MAANKPLIPVHHLRSHIAANYLTQPDLKPPFLCLVVSGGHSHIIEVTDYTSFTVVGSTYDDAAGEAYDKAARVLGFPYPGGAYIDHAAKTGNPKAYHFPQPKVGDSPYDFSFSGLKTSIVNLAHHAEQKGEQLDKNDLAASFQYTVSKVLTDRTIAAAKDLGYKQIVLAGGVSANSGLRARMARACAENGFALAMPELKFCGDNAAMVGAQGYYEYLSGNIAQMDLNAWRVPAYYRSGTVNL